MDKPLAHLIDEIVRTHHEFLPQELPSILDLLNNIEKLEGKEQPKWKDVKPRENTCFECD
ncbi:hypothetical protein [Simkania sp.]|uniref:hypothetical protein n=1 Tax=Simkania sp. TaxID=34094 RepID=UPI003B52D42D